MRGRDKEVAALKKYIVREGDTLRSISQVTGVEWKLLVAANPGVDGRHILPAGQVIAVPDIGKGATRHQPGIPKTAEKLAEVPASSPKSVPNKSGSDKVPGYFGLVWPHVVSEGENWNRISDEYQVPLEELLRMNATFASRELAAGDILYIPNVVMESQMDQHPGEYSRHEIADPTSQGLRTPGGNGWGGVEPYHSYRPWDYAWGTEGPWRPMMAYGYPTYAAGYPYGNGTTVYGDWRHNPVNYGPYAHFGAARTPMSGDAAYRMWRASLGQDKAFGDSLESSSLDSSWSDGLWDQNDGKTP